MLDPSRINLKAIDDETRYRIFMYLCSYSIKTDTNNGIGRHVNTYFSALKSENFE